MRRGLARFALMVWTCGAAACGGQSSQSATNGDASTAGDTGGAGDSGIGSIMGLNGDGGAGNAMPVQCGATTCNAPSGGAFPLSACCLDDGGCGGTFGGIPGGGGGGGGGGGSVPCLDLAPGTSDPSCPSQSIMGMTLSACCSGSGVCGFDLSMVGLGCDSLSAFGSFLMMDTGAPQACGDASGVTGDAEAGPGGDAAGE